MIIFDFFVTKNVSTRERISIVKARWNFRDRTRNGGLDGSLMRDGGVDSHGRPWRSEHRLDPPGQTTPVFRSDQLSRWMLPPTQILIQTSACSCPDASLSRLTITVAAELSAPHANIYPRPSFVHRPSLSPFRSTARSFEIFIPSNYFVLPGSSLRNQRLTFLSAAR